MPSGSSFFMRKVLFSGLQAYILLIREKLDTGKETSLCREENEKPAERSWKN